jgi:hypothetical protein
VNNHHKAWNSVREAKHSMKEKIFYQRPHSPI